MHATQSTMAQLSSQTKHHILLEYRPHSPTHSFSALAATHGVAGGKRTIMRWHKQWNGTAQSLEHRKGAGRPRVLSRVQVTRHVRTPILAANRSHRPIHYTSLLPKAQQKTHKQISIRTLRRYGQQQLHVKQKHTTKRTADESNI
jgi:hypothetical protein